MKKLKVGLIGCGKISNIYLSNLKKYDLIEVLCCSGLDLDESESKAKEFNIPIACSPEEVLKNKNVDAILNLTVPKSHAEVSLKALNANKHVYSEKPLASQLLDARKLLKLAKQKNLFLGCAPDTFFGGRWQTVKKLLDNNTIGTPIGVSAFVGTHGTERHHPNPDFYYQQGGGPMLDLGPYYISLMVFLLGAIQQVCGFSNRGFRKRKIENGFRNGELIDVEVDTNVYGLLKFKNGIIGSITMSFDVWDSEMPRLEIYGTEGTICIPDPDPVHGANIFDGEVLYRKKENARWSFQPRKKDKGGWIVAENSHGLNQDSRGIGLVDMAYAINEERELRASGDLAYHVLEVIFGILNSSANTKFINIRSNPLIPSPLPNLFPEK